MSLRNYVDNIRRKEKEEDEVVLDEDDDDEEDEQKEEDEEEDDDEEENIRKKKKFSKKSQSLQNSSRRKLGDREKIQAMEAAQKAFEEKMDDSLTNIKPSHFQKILNVIFKLCKNDNVEQEEIAEQEEIGEQEEIAGKLPKTAKIVDNKQAVLKHRGGRFYDPFKSTHINDSKNLTHREQEFCKIKKNLNKNKDIQATQRA